MFKSPCKNCTSRCNNCNLSDTCTSKAELPNGCGRCHDYCDKFLEAHKIYKEELETIRANKFLEDNYRSHRAAVCQKIAKRYGAYKL